MYKKDCLFCKIVAGEIPAYKVYENENFLVFLDIHPQAPGHVQVIPKQHHRWVWDVPTDRKTPGNIAEYFETVQKIAKAIQKAFETEVVWSRVMGDEIEHAHVWLFPHPKFAKGNITNFEENAKKIKTSYRLTI